MSARLKPWLLLAVIFVIGVVTGSALTIGLGSYFMHPPGSQQMKRVWMAHLTQRLNLTVDQQTKIKPILAEADMKIRALHHEEVGSIAQIFKETDEQISSVLTLTPAQQAELQKMESERTKLYNGRARPWAPPRDGSGGVPPPPPPPPPILTPTPSGSTNAVPVP
jgi:Spy/CpxP family protein refolding chaperone